MNHGQVHQLDAPEATFHAPANLFVARLMGSPPMNTREVTLDGGHIMLHLLGDRAHRADAARPVPSGARDHRRRHPTRASRHRHASAARLLPSRDPTNGDRATRGCIHCHFQLDLSPSATASTASPAPQMGSWVASLPATAELQVGRSVTLSFAAEDLYLSTPPPARRCTPERRRRLAADPLVSDSSLASRAAATQANGS